MQNEIEIKIMLSAENVPLVQQWLGTQQVLEQGKDTLGNTYFDTPDLYFAKGLMGLRVRSYNQQHEMTLKMKGDIVGGLHIRPEYNVDLPDNRPDFKHLVSTHHLQIENSDVIAENLQPTFSTDFVREKWLIAFRSAQIEVALDQGLIKNLFGEDPICEVEFELKSGELADLLDFIDTMPKHHGMWLSSLSKAQRGYLVGNGEKIAKEIEKLTACKAEKLTESERYRFEQQVADFLREEPENAELTQQFLALNNLPDLADGYLKSVEYLEKNLQTMKKLFL